MRFSPSTERTRLFRVRTAGHQPEGEQFWPGHAKPLATLTSMVSAIVRFSAAEGADQHCQPLARTPTAQRMFNWLDDQFQASRTS